MSTVRHLSEEKMRFELFHDFLFDAVSYHQEKWNKRSEDIWEKLAFTSGWFCSSWHKIRWQCLWGRSYRYFVRETVALLSSSMNLQCGDTSVSKRAAHAQQSYILTESASRSFRNYEVISVSHGVVYKWFCRIGPTNELLRPFSVHKNAEDQLKETQFFKFSVGPIF